jgi:tetratricopeptide (TPR) repeat protein
MMKLKSSLCGAVYAMLLLAAPAAVAEALVKPLPTPDATQFPADVAKELAAARVEFDKARVDVVGDALAETYARMGAIYARVGFNDGAAVAFYDASQLSPKDSRWIYLRGVIARTQKLDADARADYEAALTLDQNYLPIRYRLAETLVDMGDLDGAHKLLQAALPAHKDQAALLAMLGRIELHQKRYPEAIGNLDAALKLEPAANALRKDLAAAYSGQGNAQQAKDVLAGAGSSEPSIADPLVTGMYGSTPQPGGTPLQQAQQLLSQGQFGPARSKVGEALSAQADDVDALALAARIDALTGKHAVAQEEATHALKIKSDSAAANLSQGMVYEFVGDEANAFTYYQRATHADPKLADALLLLGNAQMRGGHYAEAAEYYRLLAATAPDNIEATSRLVAAQVAAGRCGDALALVNGMLGKRAQDGNLMQVFVRLASTCAAAKPQERSMALDYARALYKQRPDAGDSAALALAFAAQGKFDEAQKSQAEAIYEAVRAGNTPLAQMYRATMQQFVAKQVPDRPWPANHPYFKPERLVPVPAQTASSPPAK